MTTMVSPSSHISALSGLRPSLIFITTLGQIDIYCCVIFFSEEESEDEIRVEELGSDEEDDEDDDEEEAVDEAFIAVRLCTYMNTPTILR